MGRSPVRSGYRRLAQLWQLPLLVVSVGLFGYAAYLFIDPKPGLSVDQKLEFARKYIEAERPEAAIQFLNNVLGTHKLPQEQQGKVHLMLAESLEMGQKQAKTSLEVNHRQIIEQSRLAVAMGVTADAKMYRRLGESYEAIDKPAEALENYRRAMMMDQARTMRLQRKVIDLQLARHETGAAEASVDEFLTLADITPAERGWAMGVKAQLLADRGAFVEARAILAEAATLNNDPVAQGTISYRRGYCDWKLGDWSESERHLRTARDQLKIKHPLDADAALLLGRIFLDRGDFKTAESFYRDVIVSHPDSPSYTPAVLGRGICRIQQNADAGGLQDLGYVVKQILAKESKQPFKPETVEGLHQATAALLSQEKFAEAIETLAMEQQLVPDPPGSFFARLGGVYERRADQLERTLATANPGEKIRREQQIRDFRTKAGDSYVAYSRATVGEDKVYGEALWHGISLYDKAANLQSVITALELFVTERPDDQLAPEAMLRLGRSYQAAGLFDKAISAFQRNQFRYPQSLAASKSAVPLAEAYIAKGPESYGKAEATLLTVVGSDNKVLTPAAEEFKNALFQLAQLYYRTGRFEEAVSRLEELTQRYQNDERMGELVFLMADSYRKSAALIDVKLLNGTAQQPSPVVDMVEATTAKKERLAKARELFDRTIETYRTKPPTENTGKLYLKLAHFYKADCMYDLGSYAEAIKQYDAAAFRYQDDPSALAAYVQIVNAYCALGKMEDAKTANERAKWLLRRMPPESFTNGSFAMPKAYWEQWLKWTSSSGMW